MRGFFEHREIQQSVLERQVWTWCGTVQGVHVIIPGPGERKQAILRPTTQNGKGKEKGTEIIEICAYICHT